MIFYKTFIGYIVLGVYYDTTKRSWEESSLNCQLLGVWERRSVSTKGFSVPASPSGFRQDQFFWIGATVYQSPWFKLLGCFETYDATEHIDFDVFPIPKSTSTCTIYCSQFYGIAAIGISKKTCYCYTDVEKYRKRNEDCVYEALPENPNELFGGPNDESVVVYQYIIHSPFTHAPDFGNCAAVRYLGSLPVHHQFTSCQNRIGYICADGRVSTAEVTWTEAVRQCGTLKTDVNGHYTDLTESVKYRAFWTGFQRQSKEYWNPIDYALTTSNNVYSNSLGSNNVYSNNLGSNNVFSNSLGSNSDHIHCAAVKVKGDGTLYPVIYPQVCTKKLPSLCEKSTKVDGGWTEWSHWSKCEVVNGRGKRTKSRTCTNPSPQHGGKFCNLGEATYEENCTPPSDEL
ncbi:uncharacterized protein LOC134258192 [Saccostrea cucullata]|uniref:uncharacterized protein LOC134258192 n=1 Tax=Saccostrea cuccullata TaxID=36930 RepID=UPI002ED4A9F4